MNPENAFSVGSSSTHSALKVQASAAAPLSAAQQRYNDLLSRADALSAQLEGLQAWSDRHRHAHLQVLHQTAQASRDLRHSLLFFLHDKLHSDVLTAQQQRMARSQVRRLIGELGQEGSAQVLALAELYRLDEDEQERAQETQRLREQIEAALGQPIEQARQYQTPEDMWAAGVRQWQRQQQADEERKAARRAARKALRNPAAQEQADKQQADARHTVRTLFRQLASALHPDREPDEQERQRKTALMSEVNAAYERHDLGALLRLQMQTALVDAGAASRLSDEQLLARCALLKEQVLALGQDLALLQARLTQELGVPIRADLSEAVMAQALHSLQHDQRQVADGLSADFRRIQSDAELKRWLKEQSRAFKATFA
jgi:hypothetical protein